MCACTVLYVAPSREEGTISQTFSAQVLALSMQDGPPVVTWIVLAASLAGNLLLPWHRGPLVERRAALLAAPVAHETGEECPALECPACVCSCRCGFESTGTDFVVIIGVVGFSGLLAAFVIGYLVASGCSRRSGGSGKGIRGAVFSLRE